MELMQYMDWSIFRVLALVLFFAIFVGVLGWTLTRPAEQIRRHARLPIDDVPADGERDHV